MSGSRAGGKVIAMAYELTLEPDRDRGGSRYRVALSGDVAPAVLRQLSDWLADAMQNPAASFEIDLTEAGRASPRARLELRALVRRHRELVEQRRLSVLSPRRARRRVAGAAGQVGASASIVVDGLGAVPL
jgi:hypothetical protein